MALLRSREHCAIQLTALVTRCERPAPISSLNSVDSVFFELPDLPEGREFLNLVCHTHKNMILLSDICCPCINNPDVVRVPIFYSS